MNSNYHHGDLRNALIEAGIKLVHDQGMQSLSIRKVASICGVSHAAPHHHFKDKEDLLLAMQQHVAEKFTQELKAVAEQNTDSPDLLHQLGRAYLKFFLDNPYFHNLLFNQMGVQINLQDVSAVNYPAFDFFKNCAVSMMVHEQIPEEYWMQNVAAMWSIVHGITSLAVTQSASYEDGWCELLEKIMGENFKFAVGTNDFRIEQER